jgi:hypothetical protein
MTRSTMTCALLMASCADSHTVPDAGPATHEDCTYDAGDAGIYRLVGWSCHTPGGVGVCDEELQCQTTEAGE